MDPIDIHSILIGVKPAIFTAVAGVSYALTGVFMAVVYSGKLVSESTEPNPLIVDLKSVLYISTSSTLGLLGALASLMGTKDEALKLRTVVAYLMAGALVSGGLTMLLIAKFGFSYFLLGVSIFAGYKAFDVLTIVGIAISSMVKPLTSFMVAFMRRIFGKEE